MRKTVLYIAMSLDGYIAKANDDLSFLSRVEVEGEDYGYYDFYNTVDTIIMGRKTYDSLMSQVEEFPHADKETYIITRLVRQQEGLLHFYNGDIKELIVKLKSQKGKTIFIDGGAEVVNLLLQDKLIDELYISIIPILLGGGVRLFQDDKPEQQLRVLELRSFEKGLVQVHYSVDK